MNRLGKLLEVILKESLVVQENLKNSRTEVNSWTYDDIARHLERLVAPGFLEIVPLQWLEEYPRYFKAIHFRMSKLQGNLARDKSGIEELAGFSQRLYESNQGEAFEKYRWMLEEYRVSLFAQPVGTRIPVSAKRLEKEWLEALAQSGSK